LHRCADTQFDPQVVAVFVRIFEQIAHNLQPSAPGPQ
jgi:HD-GYP domain-containing protein (c-di-GMP phosphodiesterase class II)